MPKFTINKDYNDPQTVEADGFMTKGEFTDFYSVGNDATVFRIKNSLVYTIERVSD